MSTTSALFRGHQLQPSIDQVVCKTREFLDRHDIGRILFASEDLEYCEAVSAEFGDLVTILPMNHYRFDPADTIEGTLRRYPVKNTIENISSVYRYVASMAVLAKSNYFISGNNSGSAYVATRGDFEDIYTFDLGTAGADFMP